MSLFDPIIVSPSPAMAAGRLASRPTRRTRFAAGAGSYDAVKAKGRRQAPTGILRSEDAELSPMERRKLLSAARTIHRNYSVAAWMVRTHMNYVSTFTFQARCKDPLLNKSLENLVRWWSLPGNFDITGRFSRQQFVRMAEQRRTLDGDMGVLKLRCGQVQAIEGDKVRTPTGGLPNGVMASEFIHGVRTNAAGKPLQYCVCKRGPTTDAGGRASQFVFERLISARNLCHFGYFDRFDQVRGISPLAAAVNSLRDTYEGFDYSLCKMKVSALLGLIIYSNQADSEFNLFEGDSAGDDDTEGGEGEGDEGGSEEEGDKYEVDLSNSTFKLELDPGDKAEFIESKSPSSESQQFAKSMIEIALKALDIPYSFFAENYTNYSGARQALLQYEASASIKRDDVRNLLDHLLAWRIRLWIQDDVLPGVSMADIDWEWVPTGMSWIDPLKEVMAQLAAIGGGLTSRTAVCRERGVDWFDVLQQLEAEQKALVSRGLPATLDPKNSDLAAALVTGPDSEAANGGSK